MYKKCYALFSGLMDIKVQWFWNVGYANPKMQYLGVIVLVYNS